MIIRIPGLPPAGAAFDGEEPAALLDLDPEGDAQAESPLRFELTACLVSGGLLVRGRVRIAMRFACSRCGVFFSTTIEDSSFLRDYPLREGQAEVDVTDDLREALLLRLPPAPLCADSCAGVCPYCGTDRNRKSCGCRPPRLGDAWSALESLGDRPPRPGNGPEGA